MLKLEQKIIALQNFSFEVELTAIIEKNKNRLAELQAEQLSKGKDANNNPITLEGRGYSPFTIRQKIRKGQPFNIVRWKDTGELHRSMYAAIQNKRFGIKSDNFKFDKMIMRSGEDAVGLNEESRNEFISNVTRPGILKVYKQKVTDV